MKEYKLKVRVKADCTACAQMRVRYKDDPKWSDFVCGVDLNGCVWTANSPQVFSRTLAGLAENVIDYKVNVRKNYFYNSFAGRLNNVEEIIFTDDSDALLAGLDADDYYAAKDKVYAEQKTEFDKVSEKALRELEWSDAENSWVGTITVYECDY